MSARRPVSRRRFLTGLGAGAAGAVAAGYGISVWTGGGGDETVAPRVAKRSIGGRADRTLVVVELAGGNDGLSTVVPLRDPAYRTLRPTLAIQNPIPLDADVGLHPNLTSLAARFAAGQVAVVEGVGYPDPNLSHFASLAYWWSGTPGASGQVGWLGRYLDATVGYDDPLAGVSIGPTPSPALLGSRSFATGIADGAALEPKLPAWAGSPDELYAVWKRFAPRRSDSRAALDDVRDAIRRTGTARARLDRALATEVASGAGPADDLENDPAVSRGRRATPVTASLQLAAQLVAAERAPRIIYVSGLGDYDTHQGQAQRHPALMTDLDAGLEVFFASIEHAGVADRALVMTTSEFGRRAQENGSGTDHGAAAPHFVIGHGVKGGRYGASPALTKLDSRGNLTFGVDFRVLYATALQGWLDVDTTALLGRGFEPLPLVG